jgi:hypothetical protein
MRPNYEEQMMAKPMRRVTLEDGVGTIPFGALIGFKAFKSQDRITAAYPFWYKSKGSPELQFVLYGEDSRPVLDNDWVQEGGNEMFVNEEPIVVPVNLSKFPSTFQDEIQKLFS